MRLKATVTTLKSNRIGGNADCQPARPRKTTDAIWARHNCRPLARAHTREHELVMALGQLQPPHAPGHGMKSNWDLRRKTDRSVQRARTRVD